MKSLIQTALLLCLCVISGSAQWDPDMRLTYADDGSNPGSNNTWSVGARHDSIYIVWSDVRDGNSEIYFKRSLDAGMTWEPDVRLTDDPLISALPSILVDGAVIHVAWFDTRAGMNNYEIYYKRSTNAGETWGADTRLTVDSAISWYQSLAVTGSNLHVVWRETRDGNYDVFYKRSTDRGLSWGADTNLTQASGSSENPCITACGDKLHVLWFDNRDGGAYEIYYKRSTDQGLSWEPDVRLTYDAGVSFGPCAVARDSMVHVIWQDSRDGNWELYYTRSRDYGATWDPETRLTNAAQTSESPSVAVSARNVHVAWWDNRDGNYEIYCKTSTDRGMTWPADARLTNDGSWSQFPHLAASDSMLHVIWKDGRAGNDEIYYKRNPTGNPAGLEETCVHAASPKSFTATTVFTQAITLHFQIPPTGTTGITLYDISGAAVYDRRFTRPAAILRLNDNALRALPAGVYFMKVTSPDGFGRTIKIIKVK